MDPHQRQAAANGAPGQAGQEFRDVAQNMRSELGRAGQLAKDLTRQRWQEFSRTGSAQYERTLDYVREKPLSAVLIAAGVGFFVALLSRR